MRTMLTGLFCLRKPKNYVSGTASIYLLIAVDGKRAAIAISRKYDPAKWDNKSGRAIGNKKDAKSLTAYLGSIEYKIYEHHPQITYAEETGNLMKSPFSYNALFGFISLKFI